MILAGPSEVLAGPSEVLVDPSEILLYSNRSCAVKDCQHQSDSALNEQDVRRVTCEIRMADLQ